MLSVTDVLPYGVGPFNYLNDRLSELIRWARVDSVPQRLPKGGAGEADWRANIIEGNKPRRRSLGGVRRYRHSPRSLCRPFVCVPRLNPAIPSGTLQRVLRMAWPVRRL